MFVFGHKKNEFRSSHFLFIIIYFFSCVLICASFIMRKNMHIWSKTVAVIINHTLATSHS